MDLHNNRFFPLVALFFAALFLLAAGSGPIAAGEIAPDSAISAFQNLDDSSCDLGIHKALDFLDVINSPASEDVQEISLADIRLFGPNRFGGEEFDLRNDPENIENVIAAFRVIGLSLSGVAENNDLADFGDADLKFTHSLFNAYVSLAIMSGFGIPERENHDISIIANSQTGILSRTKYGPVLPDLLLANDFHNQAKNVDFLTSRTPIPNGYVIIILTNSRIE